MKTEWPADKVSRRAVASLLPYARNARTHSDEQVEQIARSIQEFGFTNPVLVDEDGTIIAGHGRVIAAKQLGLKTVPVMVAAGWTDAQKRAYVIADNKIALNAEWDDGLLRSELGALGDLGFDLDLTGFGADEAGEDEGGGLTVSEVPVSEVADKFWISIRGPLADQAKALSRLRESMADLADVEVDLGTVAVD